MPSALPSGDPAPADGRLPDAAATEVGSRPLGIYLHVPFCTTRCGYCDFNTYTAADLGGAPGASRIGYIDAAIAELDLAASVLGSAAPAVSTIFVGGGTPTLLPSADLTRFVAAVADRFGLAAGAEVTTESNPESVDAAGLDALVAGGFNRISFGMQSAVPHVLATLDRVHSPGRPQRAVAEAKAAGFASTSLDVIYGTPGESPADWRASLEAAVAAGPDHLSAYALIVEDGTRLAARISRGELPAPDDDDLADKYLLAEQLLTAAGYDWYELSNWARGAGHACRHNLAYWRGDHWWGIGPGAHSHVGGVRWWNVKHPATYAGRLAAGASPAHAREVLSEEDRHVERLLLEIRLADGLPVQALNAAESACVPALVARGLVEDPATRTPAAQPHPLHGVRQTPQGAAALRLTLQGRLLADAVVRELLD